MDFEIFRIFLGILEGEEGTPFFKLHFRFPKSSDEYCNTYLDGATLYGRGELDKFLWKSAY